MGLRWKEMIDGLTRCPTDIFNEQKGCPFYSEYCGKCEYFQKMNSELLVCKHLEEKGENE